MNNTSKIILMMGIYFIITVVAIFVFTNNLNVQNINSDNLIFEKVSNLENQIDELKPTEPDIYQLDNVSLQFYKDLFLYDDYYMYGTEGKLLACQKIEESYLEKRGFLEHFGNTSMLYMCDVMKTLALPNMNRTLIIRGGYAD